MKRFILIALLVVCGTCQARSRYSSSSDQIKGNTHISNPGDSLQSAYDRLSSDSNDGRMGDLTEDNRRYMWLTAGTYTGDLSVDTKYCHIRVMEGVVLSGAITHTGWYGTAFGNGDGSTFANAKNIDLPEALMEYCDTSGDQAKYIRVTANLDFTDHIQVNGGAENTSTFDGGNHVLSNMILKDNPSSKNQNGLFYTNTVVVENIVIKNALLHSSSPNPGGEDKSYAAILVAELNPGVVRNCHIDGDIRHTHTQIGSMFIGMVAGSNHGTVINCSSAGTISFSATNGTVNEGFVGGIAGYQTGPATGSVFGRVQHCKSTVTITSMTETIDIKAVYIGGLVGQSVLSGTGNALNTVLDSEWEGLIDVNYGNAIVSALCFIGGINGQTDGGETSRCSAKGRISATLNLSGGSTRCDIGGGIGNVDTSRIASDCFCDVDLRLNVTAISFHAIGGFVGRNDGATSNCYGMGSIYDLDAASTALTFDFYGGFVGKVLAGTVTDCYCAIATYTDTGTGVTEGFAGQVATTGILTDCYWDSDTSGFTTGFTTVLTVPTMTTKPVAGDVLTQDTSTATMTVLSSTLDNIVGTVTSGTWDATNFFTSDNAGATMDPVQVTPSLVADAYVDKTTAEMMTTSTFNTWVFAAGTGRKWKQVDGYEYPKVDWEE